MRRTYDEEKDFESLEDFEQYLETGEVYDPPLKDHAHGHIKTKAIGFLCVLLCICFGVIIYAFKLEKVSVIGNHTYSEKEIKDIMGLSETPANTFFTYLRYMRFKVKDIPFLEEIKVTMDGKDQVVVHVHEVHILAAIKKGSEYFYFDDQGIVQEVLKERKDTIPLIQGLKTEALEEGKKIEVEDQRIYKGIIELGELLKEQKITTDKVTVDKKGKAILKLNKSIQVNLGSMVLLEEKIMEMVNILPELEEMGKTENIKGILHLENYDSTKNSIVFTKEN